jgi:hypothetical protein
MATVCQPATGRLQASFAAVAKHYGVAIDICPARHGNRKGVVEVATAADAIIARHQRATDGAGVMVRDLGHVAALERAVLARFADRPPCRRKLRRPPSPAAQAEAARLRGQATVAASAEHVVVDLAAYAHAAAQLDRLPSEPTLPLEPDQQTP